MESIIDSKDKLHFFEYMEVDILQEYLRNAIYYTVEAITNTPSLVQFRYYAPEISALLDFAKDFYYLYVHKATYAQKFYDFQRNYVKGNRTLNALKGALVWAILPYLKNKLQKYFNSIVADELDGKQLSKFKKLIRLIFPIIYAIAGTIQTIYRFKYLFVYSERQEYYNLHYKIDRIHLGHKKKEEELKYPVLELLKKPGLLMVLMGHKVLNWYYSQNSRDNRIKQSADKKIVSAPVEEQKKIKSGMCAVCTNKIKNPTMVRTTGYVYCFDCIDSFAKKNKKCPLSQLEVDQSNLQVLYI